MSITIDVFGESAIHRELLRFGARAADAKPAFVIIASMFYGSEMKQFETEGEWGGHPWAPLAAATVAAKAANPAYSTMILQRTGALMESLTEDHSDNTVKKITAEYVDIRSKVKYGIYHQQPNPVADSILPMRKPVELPERVKVDMVKVLQAWIIGKKTLGSMRL